MIQDSPANVKGGLTAREKALTIIPGAWWFLIGILARPLHTLSRDPQGFLAG